MPNPFPGMDPYLEGPLWTSFRHSFVEEISRQLAGKLRPKYYVRQVQRPASTTKTIEPVEQTLVEVRDVAECRLIAIIEVLSMSPKLGDGLAEYRLRRRELLAGTAHFLEIDLLRAGERFPLDTSIPSAPYFVFLRRADASGKLEAWPIALNSSLPVVNVPLLPSEQDAELDLQLAMQTIYDIHGYDQPEDHQGLPVPALAPEQTAWVKERLRAAGLG